MNILPIVDFWYRQHETIAKLMGTKNRGLKLFINLVHANVPVLKKEWPGHDDLLDDFVNTIDKAFYDTLIEGVEDA